MLFSGACRLVSEGLFEFLERHLTIQCHIMSVRISEPMRASIPNTGECEQCLESSLPLTYSTVQC
jgi:hypothetical protein